MIPSFPLKLSTVLMSGAFLAASSIAISPARAFVQEDVDQFLRGFCFDCDISGADLNNRFIWVDLQDLVNATGTQFRNSRWRSSGGIQFFGQVFSSNFTSADFSGADMDLILFDDSIFTGANFTNAKLFDVIFQNSVNAPRAAFQPAPLASPTTGTNLTGANFTNAIVDGSSFENADFTGAILDGARFNNVNLLGANISQAQLNSLAFFSGTLPDGTTVPEPSVVLGLLAVGGIGFLSRRKSR